MVQAVVALAFIALVLNIWGKASKDEGFKLKVWWINEIILAVVIILGTIHANS